MLYQIDQKLKIVEPGPYCGRVGKVVHITEHVVTLTVGKGVLKHDVTMHAYQRNFEIVVRQELTRQVAT